MPTVIFFLFFPSQLLLHPLGCDAGEGSGSSCVRWYTWGVFVPRGVFGMRLERLVGSDGEGDDSALKRGERYAVVSEPHMGGVVTIPVPTTARI